jgi:hypothetical protein
MPPCLASVPEYGQRRPMRGHLFIRISSVISGQPRRHHVRLSEHSALIPLIIYKS